MSTKYDTKISGIRQMMSTLLKEISEANTVALEAYVSKNQEMFKISQDKLANVATKGDIIDNEIIKTFALYGPEAKELRSLVAYLKMTNEIVRIGEGIKKYARRMREHVNSGCNLTLIDGTIVQLHKSTIIALDSILKCFTEEDDCNIVDFYTKIVVEESKNDDLFSILEKEIMGLIIDEKELSIEYVNVLGTLRRLERSCDRSLNVANLMMYAQKGGNISVYN